MISVKKSVRMPRFNNSSGQNRKNKKEHFPIHHWQLITVYLVLYDLVTIAGSYFFALWLRFDCSYSKIDPEYLKSYIRFIPIYLVICIIIYHLMHLYHSLWRYAGYNELYRVILACLICLVIHILGIRLLCSNLLSFDRMPISYYLFGIIFPMHFCVIFPIQI